MSLKSFKVTEQKGLRLAECPSVPPLMIICGPNGSGKSTLLDAVKRGAGERTLEPTDTDILYQPPHRAIRRQSVQRRWLGGATQTYSGFLSADQLAGVEGLQVPYPQRSPDNVDESGSTIKFVLGKLENKRQSYLSSRVDAARHAGDTTLDISSIQDIFAPLGEVVQRLLPHLTFQRIDFTNEDNIRCVFLRTAEDGTSIELDLDDLSSGEKSVILLFLPLIESEIHGRLTQVSGEEPAAAAVRDRVFLLDEPELHLHPDLQRRMLAFMRERSATGTVQFMLVTHSPTILDEAGDDELFILRLPGDPTVNQLRQVASAGERLAALRELTGESYFVATGRNIVCLEGEPRRDAREGASDLSIIEVLHPRASRYTFIAMGSRTQVQSAVRRLQDGLPVDQYGVAVAGLVDGDRTEPVGEGVFAWPVCEFENLLLEPRAIVAAVSEIGEPADAPDVEGVKSMLREIAEARRDDEIRLRVQAALPLVVLRPSGSTPDEIRASFREKVDEAAVSFEDGKIEALFEDEGAVVDSLLATDEHLARFKGKALLRELYRRLGFSTTSYEQFCYTIAQHCKASAAVMLLVESAFEALDQHVDERLAAAVLV